MAGEMYTFANDGSVLPPKGEKAWTTEDLEDRFKLLNTLEQAETPPESAKEKYRREMAHIAFEGLRRQAEAGRLAEVQAEIDEIYNDGQLTFNIPIPGRPPTQWRKQGE